MSVASFSYVKISNPCSPSSSSSSSSTTHQPYRFSSTKPSTFTVRCSQADGPMRRPIATPPLRPPPAPAPAPAPAPTPAPTPTPLTPPPPPVSTANPAAAVSAVGDKNVITMEFQRLKAKELQEYFKQKKLEEADAGPFFGFIAKNEISNGRWAMFGFAVGMLTEYATGSDFVDQVKILLSNFGIIDLD